MCQKNANVVAGGTGSIVLKGFNLTVHCDEVEIHGDGNINVTASEDNHAQDHQARDRRDQQNRARQDRARQDNWNRQQRQAEAQQQALLAVQKALEQVSKQLSSLAQHHQF